MMRKFGLLLTILLLAACSMTATGDRVSDAASAQNFLPNIPGYTMTEATSITDALTAAGVGGSLLTGNLPLAALVSRLDAMMECYNGVGAVAARVYTEVNIGNLIQGQIPKIGALAVINEDRLERNFLSCALGSSSSISAQADQVQPCGGSGTFTVNNERLHYLFGATAPELCNIFQQAMPRS
jgi:hypothetical protein